MTRRRWIADASTESTASLLGAQAEHLARVLRAKPGVEAEIVVNGFVYQAVIATVSNQKVVFNLIAEVITQSNAQSSIPITLLMSIFKFDRMEWAIEKATELGVATIIPILARRTEKHLAQSAEKRVERWRRLAQEAAQQSRRADLPAIANPITLPAQLAQPSSSKQILLAENERDTTIREVIEATTQITSLEFALGPEGGWTNEEIALFEKHNWQSATLGPRILRAETAAISALAIANALLNP